MSPPACTCVHPPSVSGGNVFQIDRLVPSTYASADRLVHGRLTKRGNKYLRWAFVEAAQPGRQRSGFLREHYNRVKDRRGSKAAAVSTARKLAELTWTVWKEERVYREK